MPSEATLTRLDTIAFVWQRTSFWRRTYQLLADGQVVGSHTPAWCDLLPKAQFQLPECMLHVAPKWSMLFSSGAEVTLIDKADKVLLRGRLKHKWWFKVLLTVYDDAGGGHTEYVYKPLNFWLTHYAWFQDAETRLIDVGVQGRMLGSRESVGVRVLTSKLAAPVAWVMLSLALHVHIRLHNR